MLCERYHNIVKLYKCQHYDNIENNIIVSVNPVASGIEPLAKPDPVVVLVVDTYVKLLT